MGLGELEERLESEAEAEKKRILEEAEKKAAGETARFSREVEQAYNQSCSRTLKAAEARAKGVVGRARIEGGQKISEARKTILDEVFEESLKRVEGLSDGEKKKILKSWLEDAKSIKNPVLRVDSAYAGLLKDSGCEVRAEDLGEFGFIAMSSDGRETMDFRASRVLEKLKPGITPKLLEILWGR